MTNAEARCNKSLRPRKPEGSLGRTAQDVHLDSHTAPELWVSSVVLVGVYIPPEVNAAKAVNQLADQVLAVENANPDSVVIVVGDFNHACLSKALPRYKQHVDCSTRKDKTLDHCYTVYKGAYHASARAPLGKSEHNTAILIPASRWKRPW